MGNALGVKYHYKEFDTADDNDINEYLELLEKIHGNNEKGIHRDDLLVVEKPNAVPKVTLFLRGVSWWEKENGREPTHPAT